MNKGKLRYHVEKRNQNPNKSKIWFPQQLIFCSYSHLEEQFEHVNE